MHLAFPRALGVLVLGLLAFTKPPSSARAISAAVAGTTATSAMELSLPAEATARLDAAALDAALPDWQRQIMTRLAHGERPGPGGRWADTESGGAGTQTAPGDETWTPLSGTPKGLQGATTIYDPVGARLIVFGGLNVLRPVNEVWSLSLSGTPQWSPLATLGVAPAARYEHTAIYDSVNQRMIVQGGFSTTYLSDTWALSLGGTPTWTDLTPLGPVPAARSNHAAIFDAANQRLILFGGTNGTRRNDVWALSLAGAPAWTNITPAVAGPTARMGHTAIYDPLGTRMLVFGGNDGANRNDFWALSLGATPAWSVLNSAPGTAARSEHVAAYDSAAQRLVVSGGIGIGSTYLADTYAVTLSGPVTWSLVPAGATPMTSRAYHSAAYDPVGNQLVAVSGIRTSTTYLDEVWALSLSPATHWTQLNPPVPAPDAIFQHTAIYDPLGHRMIIFGDAVLFGPVVWALDLSGAPVWTRLHPAGPTPTGTVGHTAIYDPSGPRMLTFGGGATSNNTVWALSLDATPTWSQILTAGTPPDGRVDHASIYDPSGPRMIVFGGYSNVGGPRNDVWALSLDATPTWTELLPAGTLPNPRTTPSAVYDPLNARMIIYGGYVIGFNLHDTWALSLTGTPTWTQLPTTGGPSEAFINHTAIYDPSGPRMIVSLGDSTWALPLDGAYAWQYLAPLGAMPKHRSEQVAIYDPDNARMVMNGGYSYQPASPTAELDDTWFLSLPTAISDAPIEPPVASLLGLRVAPNPFTGATTARFTLTRPQRVELRVFDVSGRWVRTLPGGALSEGAHEAAWDGRDAGGRRVGAGVYFLRVTGADLTVTTRVVRVN